MVAKALTSEVAKASYAEPYADVLAAADRSPLQRAERCILFDCSVFFSQREHYADHYLLLRGKHLSWNDVLPARKKAFSQSEACMTNDRRSIKAKGPLAPVGRRSTKLLARVSIQGKRSGGKRSSASYTGLFVASARANCTGRSQDRTHLQKSQVLGYKSIQRTNHRRAILSHQKTSERPKAR